MLTVDIKYGTLTTTCVSGYVDCWHEVWHAHNNMCVWLCWLLTWSMTRSQQHVCLVMLSVDMKYGTLTTTCVSDYVVCWHEVWYAHNNMCVWLCCLLAWSMARSQQHVCLVMLYIDMKYDTLTTTCVSGYVVYWHEVWHAHNNMCVWLCCLLTWSMARS